MNTQHRFISITTLALVAVAGATTACSKSGDEAATHDTPATAAVAPDSSAATAPGAMGGMKDMAGAPPGASMRGRDSTSGMSGMMSGMSGGKSGGMSGDMAGDMKRMMSMSGDQMKAMVPAHRKMVATMLSQMNTEMGQMHMTGDAAWTATVDSLRQDLVRMPDLSASEMKAMMPDHMARITRLEDMHGRMTAGMKK